VVESWDLADGSHLMIAGQSRSGRSNSLRVLAGGIARLCSPEDVHLYGIDAGNNAPTPVMTTPTEGQLFKVGQAFTLSGSGFDPEDGNVPKPQLTWQVIKHHATHTHPFLPPTAGNNILITGPAPEDLSGTTNT